MNLKIFIYLLIGVVAFLSHINYGLELDVSQSKESDSAVPARPQLKKFSSAIIGMMQKLLQSHGSAGKHGRALLKRVHSKLGKLRKALKKLAAVEKKVLRNVLKLRHKLRKKNIKKFIGFLLVKLKTILKKIRRHQFKNKRLRVQVVNRVYTYMRPYLQRQVIELVRGRRKSKKNKKHKHKKAKKGKSKKKKQVKKHK